jgi:hypothetical protein
MKPHIDRTMFGSITIEGEIYERDVIIRLDGKIKKRKKKLSKAVYGTSHMLSIAEAQHIYQDGAERLIIGSGHYGMVELSEQAVAYLKKKQCQVDLRPTPEAIDHWNGAQGAVIGLFHVTC